MNDFYILFCALFALLFLEIIARNLLGASYVPENTNFSSPTLSHQSVNLSSLPKCGILKFFLCEAW